MKRYYCISCSQEFTRRWNLKRHARYMHPSLNMGSDINESTRIKQRDAVYRDPVLNLGYDISKVAGSILGNQSYADSSLNLRFDSTKYARTQNIRGGLGHLNSANKAGFNLPQNYMSEYTLSFPVRSLTGLNTTDDQWKAFSLQKLTGIHKTLRNIHITLQDILSKIK
jgi:hypothetical protein